jgi:acyl transferase domain-containing protein
VPGGYLDNIDEFDSLLFHVSPAEAVTLDPQERLALQTAWQAIEDAGHTPMSLRHVAPRVGVFAGVMWQDHRLVGMDRWRRGEPAQIFAGANEIPNRISYCFGFTGPSVAVDTSCSSSLTALHLALQSLTAGECDAALVVGVNLVSHRYHLDVLADQGLLRADGDSSAFGADGSGWLPGEGVGALLLRPATAALAAGDPVRGVVESTWIGHYGGGGRYGAANDGALAESIGAALFHAGLDPDDIDYVECAAAGAAMADAAEVTALAKVFGSRPGQSPLLVGTVKPNNGHLEAAAGLSQLTKVLLQFEHGRIAPTVLADRISPLTEYPGIEPVAELRAWHPAASGRPLRALINATGAAGSCAHAVLRSLLNAPPDRDTR